MITFCCSSKINQLTNQYGEAALDQYGNHIGTWESSYNGSLGYGEAAKTDFGVINAFEPNGANIYSGDAWAPDWALVPGAPICKHGTTTGASCGVIVGREGNTVALWGL